MLHNIPEERRTQAKGNRKVLTILSSIPTRCTVIQYSLLLSMLYMFQAVSPPIIRSSKLYTQHVVYFKLACCKLDKILYHCQCSTCFRWFLRPSSGAQELYTQHVYFKLACSCRYMFQAVSPPITRSSKLYTQHLIYVKLACCKLDILVYRMLCVVFELLMMGGETA